jgi:PAS domain-containing protein
MQRNYTNILLDNSDDYFWVLDVNYNLVYANKAYLEHIKEVIGKDKELNTTVFVEGFGDGYIEKWKGYYSKAFQGISYQTDMELNNPGSNF